MAGSDERSEKLVFYPSAGLSDTRTYAGVSNEIMSVEMYRNLSISDQRRA